MYDAKETNNGLHKKRRVKMLDRLFYSMSKGLFMLLVIGGTLMFLSGSMFITSLKPVTDFEDLQEIGAEVGMHIKGDVKYAWDCFAYEETWTENRDGSRSPAKTSHYYYAIPGKEDTFFALEVAVDAKEDMENLAEETVEYISGGEEPATRVAVEGRMSKMDKEMQGLFKEYLQEIGYTTEEIENMGELLYIQQPNSMRQIQVMFGIGALLVLIGIVLFIRSYKKSGEDFAAAQQAGLNL